MKFENKDFVHFHVHSDRSRFDGLAKIDDLVLQARKMGFPALALTDHGNIMGWIQFLKACSSTKDKKGKPIPYSPIKAILGCEFYLSRNMDIGQYKEKRDTSFIKKNQPDGRRGNRHINLFAMNFEGYKNICRMSQKSYTDGFYFDPRIDIELLSKHSRGVMCGSACLSSIINANLMYDNYDRAKHICSVFKDIYNENFFLEIMFHGISEERELIPLILKLSSELDIPVICTNDCFVDDTFINTSEGIKQIKDVDKGDLVLTHNGMYKEVIYKNKRKLKETEDIFEVTSCLGSYSFRATVNHPIYVGISHRVGDKKIIKHREWKKVGELTNKDYLVIPKIHPENIFCGNSVSVKTIDLLDYYKNNKLTKKTYKNKNNIECINSGRARKKGIDIPRNLKIDDNFLEIIGLYIAEGYCNTSTSTVSFGVHIKEQHFVKMVEKYFLQFGLRVEKKITGTDRHGINLRITSSVFSHLFSSLCGRKSKSKTLPKFKNYKSFNNCFSREQLLKILGVYIEGDGCEPLGRKQIVIGSTSSRLIFEISSVFNSIGILSLPCVRKFKQRAAYKKFYHKNPKADFSNWNDLYVLHISGNKKQRLQYLLKRNVNYIDERGVCSYLEDSRYYYVKIKNIILYRYDKDVYNLEVDEDNSYTANFFAVHNCHYIMKNQGESQEILLCMSQQRCIKDPKRLKFGHMEFYLKSAQEMADIFGGAPYCLYNSKILAERIDTKDIEKNLFGGMRLPKFGIPIEYKNSYEYMSKLAWEGMKKVGWDKSEKHIDALKMELGDVKVAYDSNNYDFSTYFLIVRDYIQYAKNNDILVGCGRGSGYASVLLRCLDITYGIDPLQYGLIWERFLGFSNSRFIKESDFGFEKVPNLMSTNELDKNRELEEDLGGVDRY